MTVVSHQKSLHLYALVKSLSDIGGDVMKTFCCRLQLTLKHLSPLA